jgi:hypothetical protein
MPHLTTPAPRVVGGRGEGRGEWVWGVR